MTLAIPALGQAEHSCDDEQSQAAAWIHWASEKRAACRITSQNPDARTRCLQEVREELARLGHDYAQVYSGQIHTLEAGHPVIKNLIARLRDHVRAAEAVITTDAEPEQIAAFRKQICLNRR